MVPGTDGEVTEDKEVRCTSEAQAVTMRRRVRVVLIQVNHVTHKVAAGNGNNATRYGVASRSGFHRRKGDSSAYRTVLYIVQYVLSIYGIGL